jgi:hypothetical protein
LSVAPNETILSSNTPHTVAGFERRSVAGFGAPNDTNPAAVPEIDPAGMGSVLPVIGGCLGLLERRRKRADKATAFL